MPGIHVRKAGKFDWIQQNEGPTLAVPGSYWLCYRERIYKFIFRYHRDVRNTMEFNFGRELMKVIRKIVKFEPRQGQQFGTSHLLITYNQTSWTRQDKIFAMLKFKERQGAAAFSCAFVLTINILHSLVSIQFNTERSLASPSVQSSAQQAKASSDTRKTENNVNIEEASAHTSRNDLPQENDECKSEPMEEELESKDNTRLDNSSIVANLDRSNTNKRKHSTGNSTDSVSSKQSGLKNNSREGKSLKHNASTSGKARSEKHNIKNTKSTLLNDKTYREDNCIADSSKRTDTRNAQLSADVNLLSELSKFNVDNELTDKTDDCKSKMNFSDDSITIPYQYLIEREIESAKKKTDKNTAELQNSKKRKLSEYPREDGKNQDLSLPKKRKYVSDNKSRSSDITDLVMEGLMFTIRQGQDSVAVIEQKTKFEVDEVLENSEKCETEEGEKCLRNSSLLGLENLITMIELPKQAVSKKNTISQNKESELKSFMNKDFFSNSKRDTICKKTEQKQENSGVLKNNFTWHNTSLASINSEDNNETGEFINQEQVILDTNEKRAAIVNYLEVKEKNQCNEEGVLPKALLNDINSKYYLEDKDLAEKLKQEISEMAKGLLDDTNSLSDTSPRQSYYMPKKIITDKTSVPSRHSSRLPIVVSNEIITTEQLPLAIQNVLSKKFDRKIPLNNQIETEKNDSNKSNLPLNENTASDTESKTKAVNCDTLENTEHAAETTLSMHVDNPIHTDSISSPAKTVLEQKPLKLEEDKDDIQKMNASKSDQFIPSKLQDITEDFYKELLQKKNPANEQRCLRQRRRSLNTVGNIKGDETRVEMLKFIQDITRGAKVVIRRMSTKSIHNIIGKSSSLATCMN